jgi:hypothetical protein
MLNEMSEARRLMLQAAAAREDRLLEPPANARGAAARTIAGKLIDAGWAKEIKALNGAPIWRRDAASGSAFALKLTAKGLKAVAGSSEESAGAAKASVTVVAEQAAPKTPSRQTEHRPAVRTAGFEPVDPTRRPRRAAGAGTQRSPNCGFDGSPTAQTGTPRGKSRARFRATPTRPGRRRTSASRRRRRRRTTPPESSSGGSGGGRPGGGGSDRDLGRLRPRRRGRHRHVAVAKRPAGDDP